MEKMEEMEKMVERVLSAINTSKNGLVFTTKKGESFSIKKNEDGSYSIIKEGEKRKSRKGIDLSSLINILNTEAMKDPIRKKFRELEKESKKLDTIRKENIKTIDKMNITPDEKDRLRMLVRQITMPSWKVGSLNKVYVRDAEREDRARDYLENKDKYETRRCELFYKAEEVLANLELADGQTEKDELIERAKKLVEEADAIPRMPDVLEYISLGSGGEIQLVKVKEIGEGIFCNDRQPMTIEQVAEFIKDKDVELDQDLVNDYYNR